MTKNALKWLARIFPAFKREWKPVVVVELPDWTEADAANMGNFLESRTGQRFMDRMRHTAVGMCVSSEEMDSDTRALRRSFALVIEGVGTLADVHFWRARKMQEEYLSDRFNDNFEAE